MTIVQAARRSLHFALSNPAREVLFTVVGREAKYKSKNVLDTVVYRAGDAASGWFFAGLKALGLGLAGTAVVGLPLAVIWTCVGIRSEAHTSELQSLKRISSAVFGLT